MLTNIFGDKLRQQVEDRLKFYELGEIPKKNIDVMKEAILEANQAIQEAKKAKKKKKDKKKRKLSEVNGNENDANDVNGVEGKHKIFLQTKLFKALYRLIPILIPLLKAYF